MEGEISQPCVCVSQCVYAEPKSEHKKKRKDAERVDKKQYGMTS